MQLFLNWKLSVGAQYRSQPQNFNFYQNESNYIILNWDQPDLENTIRTRFHAALGHPRWLQLQGVFHRICKTTRITFLPQRIGGKSSWLQPFNPKMN